MFNAIQILESESVGIKLMESELIWKELEVESVGVVSPYRNWNHFRVESTATTMRLENEIEKVLMNISQNVTGLLI